MVILINSISPPFRPFTYKSLDALRNTINELNLKIPISSNLSVLKNSIEIKNITLANRLTIQPMEGFDSELNGAPSKFTLRRYKRYAKSGVGLIWFEATAISDDCKSNEHQLVLNEKNMKSFKTLVSTVRSQCDSMLNSLGFKERSALILQLNHSGRYTKRGNKRFPLRGVYNEVLDSQNPNLKAEGIVVDDDYLKNVEDQWIEKAILAEEAGFDGVDIKSCHGYLISELLGSRTRQNSNYGGQELENRSRLLINIIKRLTSKIKNLDFIITTRFGVYDGFSFPYGFGVKNEKCKIFPTSQDLTEPIKVLELLRQHGVKLVNLSAGDPHYKPFITRPYDVPVQGGEKPPEHPLFSLNRLIFLTSLIKNHFQEKLTIIGSGYSYFRQYAGNVIAGLIAGNKVDLAGFGRMSFANPEFASQLFQNGVIDKNKACIACSKCSQLMRIGEKTGCSIRDPMYKKSINN